MKFLCPSCKAKYQIAEAKIAGKKTPRMKCRKCGHVIDIREAAASGADAPKSSAAPGLMAPGRETPPPASSPPTPAPAPAAPRPVAAPRPAAPARPTPEPAVATPAAVAVAPPARTPAPAGMDDYSENDDEMTQFASGGLASAFAAAVAEEPASTVSPPAGDEWYVGINNVPVGPMRLQTLRQKAAQGSVSPESLVWREGFEEWLPLKTFPELLAIVEEGLSSARASLTPPTAQGTDVMVSPGTGLAGFGAGMEGPSAPSGPVVITEKPEDDEDFAAAAGLPKRRSPWAAWVAVIVALMFGLTIGFVVFSTRQPPEPIVKYVEVPAKGAEGTQAASDGEESPEAPPEGDGDGTEPAKVASGKGTTKVASGKGTSGNNTEGSTKKGLSGLSGLKGLSGGPTSGPGKKSGAAAGGKPLDSAIVQRTVSRYKGSVKRGCWQPALDTRDKNAPSSARVSVSITVGPDGSVRSASTSGDPRGYRGLASCISGRVRTWRFPQSGDTTTVNVPFVFASQ